MNEAQLNEERVAAWLAAKEAKAKAERAVEEAERNMLADMGDMLVGACGLGVLTLKQIVSNRIDTKQLRERFAEIAQQVTVESTSVRLVWKGAK